MDVAYELTPLVIGKLVVYTFGSLVHFFLMVLILGNRRLHRLEWLLFSLMSALFLWYAGNLLALNISLPYGAGPAVQSGISRTISIMGFLLAVPLLVHVQAQYLAKVDSVRVWVRVLVACFYVPVIFSPWIVGRLLGHLGVGPLVALGPLVRLLVLWAAASLLLAAGINGYLSVHRRPADPVFAKFHVYLGVFQALLALGWAMAYLPHSMPIGGGLGGYLPTALMLAGIFPSGLMGYCIFRYNFLDLRVQRNVVYSVAAIFGSLIYLNFMLRVSGWLETHGVLPAAVTEAVMIFILVVLVEPLRGLISRALHEQFVSEFEIIQKLAAELEEHAKRTGDADSLQRLVEERVPHELGLERVRLLRGPSQGSAWDRSSAPHPHRVPIVRGGKAIATLAVVTATGEVSGDQRAALEILAGRLAAALELCGLISDKINLERELAARERMAFLGEMAARIAHNVKNPLSGMKTIVQLMEEDAALPEGARRDCRMILDEIDRLNRNISQVLRYAKPARNTDRPADLANVVKRVVAISRTEAEQRRVTFEVSASEPCPVEGGEEAASDVVSNLVVNALEASDDGGTIQIGIARPVANPEDVELIVEDHGRGVPKDRLERIFQPFFTTRPGGTGLGLAIVKRRLDEIGGSVECQSPVDPADTVAPHPGARFVVRFRGAESPNGKRPPKQESGLGNSSVA